MKQHPNYVSPGMEVIKPAKDTPSANPKATKTVGYQDHRGNAATKGGPNYGGGAGRAPLSIKKSK